jgi:alkanesulfonate monooxygenase SsuD/methylene tetrahydromethanopterin reductase-like flavin-dependent oxidoreductase (luciferase family)
MKFGLWDHFDSSGRPFHKDIDERLAFLIAGDEAGFHCFHVAEHHCTPLNLVPVPGVYLGAVARLTSRMRLGTLCYLLPLYSPLRLIEEVAMLDNMSHGRLEIGVGRGVSPFELNFHNVDPETSREVFVEALEVLEKGMTSERLNHQG